MRNLKDLKVKCQKLEDEIKEKSNTIAAMKEVEDRNINNTEEDVSRSVEYLSKSTQVSNTSYTENTENKLDKDTDNINMSSNNLSNDIQMLVNRRFDKIEENIDRIISRKLEEKVLESTATKLTDAVEQNRSYASSLRASPEVVNNFESIIRSTKNNELIQKKEREKRAANLKIYGINEESDEQRDLKEHDNNFINSFLGVIGISLRPNQIIRLGKVSETRKRPVKIVMNNSADKNSIMARLGNLKNAVPIYKSLSVRDDYTIEERELIKEWVMKADNKNKENNTQAWKVRGTPKNGLRLVKITKRM